MLKATMEREAGFTIVELLIVIVVIAILLTITGYVQTVALVSARDSERADDTASIARLLEDDYTDQTVGLPAYPPADQFVNDSHNLNGTASGASKDTFQAPGKTDSSMVSATNANAVQPRGQGSPSLDEYVYQPIHADGTLCNDAIPCVSYRLFYRREDDGCATSDATGCIITLESAHQQ